MSEAYQILLGLGVALGIGLLIGLEREWEDKPIGIRSFALIGLLGGVSGLLSSEAAWLVAAGLVGLTGLLAVHHWHRGQGGITTYVAALVVFLIGAAATLGHIEPAVVCGGAVALVLHWKTPIHGWVDRLGSNDLETTSRFVLIALVILPVLPDETYGPFDVFNPYEAWFLVVLIVGLNLAGYVAFRLAGAKAGAWMAGLLGGLVSSTATAVSYAGMSKRTESLGTAAALVILIASTVVYPRIWVELGVVAPDLLPTLLWPTLAFAAVMLTLCLVVFVRVRGADEAELPERDNPAQLKTALTFAALYVAILFAVAATREYLGQEALYGVAFISGLTDVDALTLSLGKLFNTGSVEADQAWRAIFLATLANLLFKIGAASFLGAASLRKVLLATGGLALVVGTSILVLWP